MQHNRNFNQTIGLAGVLQSAMLVHHLATEGTMQPTPARGLIYSIFETDPETTADIYDGYGSLRLGLEHLAQGMIRTLDPNILRYFLDMTALEKRIIKMDDLLTIMENGIETTHERLDHYDLLHENIIAGLADIYTQTLSRIRPRIMVRGVPEILNRENVANDIRALLLAGVRSATLWDQAGGARWHLIFSQARISRTAQEIIKSYL